MSFNLDPFVKHVLDGDVAIEELPIELRAEAETARRVLGAVDRAPVALSADFDARVMAAVRVCAARRPLVARALGWVRAPHEVRIVVRPWIAGALAAAAALVVLLGRVGSRAPQPGGPEDVAVRFVLLAPEAQSVSLAGTFNQWDAGATPLVRGEGGLWTTTLVLQAGEHQYAFVVDGARWVADPAAPAVDDGFGRRNSVLALTGGGRDL